MLKIQQRKPIHSYVFLFFFWFKDYPINWDTSWIKILPRTDEDGAPKEGLLTRPALMTEEAGALAVMEAIFLHFRGKIEREKNLVNYGQWNLLASVIESGRLKAYNFIDEFTKSNIIGGSLSRCTTQPG